jgi:hypothetical protein
MTTKKTKKAKEKSVDLPPTGARNPDPLSGASGAHPIETGAGAAVGGAAAGLAIGALGGPVGAVIGGIVGGAVAGGLAGKGVGELIDPTLEDTWLREYHGTRTDRKADETHEHYRPAYRYGLSSYDRHAGKRFDDVETDLRSGWDQARGTSTMGWDDARGAVRHAYDRMGTHRSTACPTGIGSSAGRTDTGDTRRDNVGATGGRSQDRGHKA